VAYDGFISYSHAADGQLAPSLQRGLELLAKRWNSRRSLRVFRDETGLSTTPDLWAAIERALDDSEWFVLLASPASAASEWVNKEVARWIRTKSVDHILPVVTDGTWVWDPVERDFTEESSAVPDALRGELSDEPRHLDLRWARSATDLDLRNSQFRSAVADLAAPMHGVAKDELEGEDIRQHRRTRRLARSAVGALVLLVVIATLVSVFAVVQRNGARTATAVANQELLVADSQTQIGSNPELSMLLATEADRRAPSTTTRNALVSAVLSEPNLQRRFGSDAGDVALLQENRIVIVPAAVGADRGQTLNRNIVQVWNWETGRREPWAKAPRGDATSGPLDVSSSSDGSLLAVLTSDGRVQMYSGRTLVPDGRPFSSGLGELPVTPVGGATAGLVLSANGQTLVVDRISVKAAGPLAGHAVVAFSRSGNRWVPDPAPGSGISEGMALSPDGQRIATATATATGSEIAINNVHTGAVLFRFAAPPTTGIAVDWDRDRVVLSQSAGTPGDAAWYDFKQSDPSAHEITIGSGKQGGQAWATYDAGYSMLGINSPDGAEVFDAATMAPLTNVPVLPTNNYAGPFVFLDSDHVLTATFIRGPMSVWNLSGTSALATRPPSQFNLGVYPAARPGVFDGFSSFAGHVLETVLDANERPLAAPFVIGDEARNAPLAEQIAESLAPVVCANPRNGETATVSGVTGDITVRSGSPPYRVLSNEPGGASAVIAPISCEWAPDGNEIAIGNFSPTNHASVALYDFSRKALTLNLSVNLEAEISGLVFSSDSKTLWIGGATSGSNGVYRVSDLDQTAHIAVAFPGAETISSYADSRRLVVAYPSALGVFDAETGRPVTRTIFIPGSGIYAVSSSPDGRYAVVNTSQGWRLVDLVAQAAIGPAIPDQYPSLPVMGTNETVYTQALDGRGEIWNFSSAHLRDVACNLAGRNLSAGEWRQYLSWAGPRRGTCPQYPLS
jgi:WD40 repeat protein